MDGSSTQISSQPSATKLSSSLLMIGNSASVIANRSGYLSFGINLPLIVNGPGTLILRACPSGASLFNLLNSSTVPKPLGADNSSMISCLPLWSCAGGPNFLGDSGSIEIPLRCP